MGLMSVTNCVERILPQRVSDDTSPDVRVREGTLLAKVIGMDINTKYFIHTVCVVLVLVGSFMPGASAEDVLCRGIVTGVPNFGVGFTGAGGVNLQIDETTDQSGNLTWSDNVTVTWPIVPPFVHIDATVGDRVEVYGEYCNVSEMPINWSDVKERWINLTESDHYLMGLDIRLTGIATECIEAPENMTGAPDGWNVSVHEVLSGQQPCSNRLNVTTQTVLLSGYVDPNIEEGDRVCVYGSYYNDSDGCGVSLSWSPEYYINKSSQWNAVDAVIALRLAASGESGESCDWADVSSDGRVTSLDALMILQAALGRIQLR